MAEAYRTIPIHPSQWPAAVVRTSDTHGCIDTCVAFGATPSAGIYGHVADGEVEVMRHHGIGPLDKWVDDHIFLRIRREYIAAYNKMREKWHSEVSPEIQRAGARIWFQGKYLDNDEPEEFNEDCSQPIRDLASTSPRSAHDSCFSYSFEDIDAVSNLLGIPWERTKDQPFSHAATYIGFLWDLKASTVSLSPSKAAKYLQAIHAWRKRQVHVLRDVEELYGKLLHACAALPCGRAYLTGLEAMLKTGSLKPFMPHRAHKKIADDLDWWTDKLQNGDVQRPISPPLPFSDIKAYSDASSTIGIGITIGERWGAWRLIPGWRESRGCSRDIGWAEAIGLEFSYPHN